VKNKVIIVTSQVAFFFALQIETNVRLFHICVQFEIESREEKNKRFLDEVQGIITKLNQAIVKAHDSSDRRKDLMKTKIARKIPKLKEATEIFLAKVLHERLLDIDSPLESMLEEVDHLDKRC
jgi:hypothetical protein